MRARLDDAALVEHDQPVHLGQRRQAVGDRDHCLAFHQREQVFLDRRLHFRIERRCRLVEHQDRRVLQEDAGDRDALALAAGELDAPFADLRIEPLAALLSTSPSMNSQAFARFAASITSASARIRTAIGDVVADRAVQQRRILRHHADQASAGCPATPRRYPARRW